MNVEIKTPLPRLTWKEAMERYGSDKPDIRFGFELKKLNDVVAGCGFKVFTDALAAEMCIRDSAGDICAFGQQTGYFHGKVLSLIHIYSRIYVIISVLCEPA